MYYHIIINKNNVEEARGKASTFDELLKLLNIKEIKSIFDHNAYESFKNIFEVAKLKHEDSFIMNVNGITINLISNGHDITTMVFYF